MMHMGQHDAQINCPRCHIPMIKQPDANAPGVIIDLCPGCGGTWFDQGELPAVVNAVASRTGFRARPQSHFNGGGYRGHGSYHHKNSGFFGSLFSS